MTCPRPHSPWQQQALHLDPPAPMCGTFCQNTAVAKESASKGLCWHDTHKQETFPAPLALPQRYASGQAGLAQGTAASHL